MEKWLKVEVTAFCKLFQYSEFPKEFMAEVLNSPSSTESASLRSEEDLHIKKALCSKCIFIFHPYAHHEYLYIVVQLGNMKTKTETLKYQTYHILPKAKQTLSCNIGQSSKAKVSSIISVLGQSQVISRADDY